MEATLIEKKTMPQLLDDRWNEIWVLATLIGAYDAHLNFAKSSLINNGQDVSVIDRFLKVSKHIWEHRNDADMSPSKARELMSMIY